MQVNEGKADVGAVIKTRTGYEHVGATMAQSNCWSFLKGGLTVTEPGPVQLYFQVKTLFFFFNFNFSKLFWYRTITVYSILVFSFQILE